MSEPTMALPEDEDVMGTPDEQNPEQTPPKRGEFWERHSVLAWALSIAVVVSLFLLVHWLGEKLLVIWRSGGPKSYVVGGVLGLVMIHDFVTLYRRDWSQRSTTWELAVRRVWMFLALALMLFVGGLLALLVGKIEERIVGGAVSLLIAVGYFRLRAVERRKRPLQPSPWFFWF